MTLTFAFLFVVMFGMTIVFALKNQRVEAKMRTIDSDAQAAIARVKNDANQQILATERQAEASIAAARTEADQQIGAARQQAESSIAEAQRVVDQQFSEIRYEVDRVRTHYEAEARKAQSAAEALVAKTIADFEPLRKYQCYGDAENDARRQISEALEDAAKLRAEAKALIEQAKNAAAEECLTAEDRVKEIHEQADARLNQAIRDSARIVANAEKQAEQIGGDAYRALREKDSLEQAAEAIRNKIEGYGDRYLVPSHSVLDDLADKYGYDAAAQALKSARAVSARMVLQGTAATCDYAEANRRKTAIQFVVHAFNGEVDSILTKVMTDNPGTLAQNIRDAFATVNKDGTAFRNARVLPAYLNARLNELDCAVRMKEFVQRVRDQQRAERERLRDEQKAEQERQEQLRQAAKEKELMQRAVNEAEKKFAQASAEQKAEAEKQMHELRQKLAEATSKELTIAQQTRKGSIYIISNEGSFGPSVYKIGFTRRDPEIRVDELYNASVPFEFEIHGVITSDNAPQLEHELHRTFLQYRWNKKNFSKEFFRVDLKQIREVAGKLAPVIWRETEEGNAAEWRESLEIEKDPGAKQRWLLREQAAADERWRKRERRFAASRTFGTTDDGTAGRQQMDELPATDAIN